MGFNLAFKVLKEFDNDVHDKQTYYLECYG
jgi:hypothetical protein